MIAYVCKYTPVEILRALGGDPQPLDGMRSGFNEAERVAGPNICGFGKTVIEAVFAGEVHELVLANCCDTIRTVHDILLASGKLDFLYLMDLPHCSDSCAREHFASELRGLAKAYGKHRGADLEAGRLLEEWERAADARPSREPGPYVALLGSRAGAELEEAVCAAIDLPVRNLTCVRGRALDAPDPDLADEQDLGVVLERYAGALLDQMPCMRMFDPSRRSALSLDPDLVGILYHTVRFCDFYGMEYKRICESAPASVVKIESDYTTQGSGQLRTRVEAFAESLRGIQAGELAVREGEKAMADAFYAGIDSGSTSTDAVIIDGMGAIVGSAIVPTGAGSAAAAAEALRLALADAALDEDRIASSISTGYGRDAIEIDGRSVTEITCHARGAHAMDPRIRTIIDIGGQDSKAIEIDAEGRVVNFAMNDKCAAGTGRFLEMMARTLQLEIGEMAQCGAHPAEDITISSTCSVFAESEVVSLIAQGKDVGSIIHGLNAAIAVRAHSLVRRVNGEGPYMMTGGVAQNSGVVAALSERLAAPIAVDERAQLVGAYGAALIAAGL